MPTRVVEAENVTLWTESFGDHTDPPVLLIAGASGQGTSWYGFCDGLVEAGRYVVIYDHRDTGQSTCFDFASHPYSVDDLAVDAVEVLDAYEIDRAHIVGISMGGIVGQLLALDHGDRVRSLTSLMSSPSGAAVAGAAVLGDGKRDDVLPGADDAFVLEYQRMITHPPATLDDHVDAAIRISRAVAGSRTVIDVDRARSAVQAAYTRARSWANAQNHGFAVAAAEPRLERLGDIMCPVLVIHGTEDPVFPLEHGIATAKAIPGASLLTIDGLGHELPEWAWPEIIAAIVDHTAP